MKIAHSCNFCLSGLTPHAVDFRWCGHLQSRNDLSSPLMHSFDLLQHNPWPIPLWLRRKTIETHGCCFFHLVIMFTPDRLPVEPSWKDCELHQKTPLSGVSDFSHHCISHLGLLLLCTSMPRISHLWNEGVSVGGFSSSTVLLLDSTSTSLGTISKLD